MADAPADKLQSAASGAVQEKTEPPVVARLVVEIRSDGTRTVARGALEDATSGEKVQLEAEGATPFLLIASLLKSFTDIPTLARKAAGLFLTGKPPAKPK